MWELIKLFNKRHDGDRTVVMNLKKLKINTLILSVLCLVSIVFTGIQGARIINAAKVAGEILGTYVVTGRNSQNYNKSVALMTVTEFFANILQKSISYGCKCHQ